MAEDPVTPTERRDSSSPSSAHPSQQPKKRTRASKPKVRTGCITCKIRRVKCGEEKPACVRCTSTGRTCDGYDKSVVPSRYRSGGAGEPSLMLPGGGGGVGVGSSSSTAEQAQVEFVRACQWSEALRSMRPLAADIDGTEIEKRFFHGFRTAKIDGLAEHVCTFADFWNRLAVSPDTSTHHQDDAVKHALVAVGAAFTLFQSPSNPVPVEGFTRDSLDVFIIQQYNKSISKLQRHVGSASTASIQITLLCCLAFICLETLRANHTVAVTHLINGLKILESLPASAFDFLADRNAGVMTFGRQSATRKDAPFDMTDIIQLFGRLEVSACFFTTGIRPVVAERGYAYRLLDDGSDELPFANVLELDQAIRRFQRDAMARLHQSSHHHYHSADGGSSFWNDPSQQQQQACLSARSARLGVLVDQFLLSGSGLPEPDTIELMCVHLDLLLFRCAQLFVEDINLNFPLLSPISASPAIAMHHHRAILRHATIVLGSPIVLKIRNIHGGSSSDDGGSPAGQHHWRISMMDTSLIGPLYTVAAQTEDLGMRMAVLQLVADFATGGNDGDEDAVDRIARLFSFPASDNTASFHAASITTSSSNNSYDNDANDNEDDDCFDDDESGGGGYGSSGSGIAAGISCWPSHDIPRSLAGLGCVPRIQEALVLSPIAGARAAFDQMELDH